MNKRLFYFGFDRTESDDESKKLYFDESILNAKHLLIIIGFFMF